MRLRRMPPFVYYRRGVIHYYCWTPHRHVMSFSTILTRVTISISCIILIIIGTMEGAVGHSTNVRGRIITTVAVVRKQWM